jgi:hypothetical protein
MDSRQRFVIIYATLSFIPLTIFSFLGTTDLGLYASSYAILYFALRLIFNPKLRTQYDYLGFILLGIFAAYLASKFIVILHGSI